MSWTVSRDALESGARAQLDLLRNERSLDRLEMTARGVRWLDRIEESRRLFHEAAFDLIERVEDGERVDAGMRSRGAGYLALAGEPGPAREWGLIAAEELLVASGESEFDDVRLRRVRDAIATLYLCGEPDRALEVAREKRADHISLDLIEGERRRDLAACDRVITGLVRGIVVNRAAPFEVFGNRPIEGWDWLEIAHHVRARVLGEPQPSHAEILERSGLLGPGPSRRVVCVDAGGVDRFQVPAADGSPIEATVDREDPEFIEIVLDPRARGYLALGFERDDEGGYAIQLYIEPESSPQMPLPYEGSDFREVIEAAADRLDGSEVFGRDGTWAARTLLAIGKNVPVTER